MHHTTGELAKRAGVNVETLRFYERSRRPLNPGYPLTARVSSFTTKILTLDDAEGWAR